MAAWNRVRSLRTGRSLRNRFETNEDVIELDYTKDPTENVKLLLRNVVNKQGMSKSKKLAYLNSLVKFFQNVHIKQLELSLEEILICLRLCLFNEAREVRAAGLRAIRYLLEDETAIDVLWKLQFDHLIARSLDIFLDNQTERLQALRIMRKVVHINSRKFPSAFTMCLISIANDGSQERDHVLRVALATLSELVVLNPDITEQSHIVSALLRNILDCQHARISESLVGTIIFLLNDPKTRFLVKPKVDLERIVAPFTDCHYRHTSESLELQSDEREVRFAASKMAILSALRSWPGMIRLCRPSDSGLQSLIDVLYLPNEDVRKGILDILFDLFRIPIPEWTEDFSTALLASDSSTMQESWKLYDGFIVEEGKSILQHLSYQRPNLVENYLALLLLAFINVGVMEAIVQVIVGSCRKLSVRATVLLGELLHLANTRLPYECSQHSHCLPTLISVAASFDKAPEHRHCASIAITCLNRVHALKKRGPVPSSIFLEQLMQFATKKVDVRTSKDRTTSHFQEKDIDELTNQSIKDSQVLTTHESSQWDWTTVDAIFKLPGNAFQKLEDTNHKQFLKRIINYYKPTTKQFSSNEQNRDDSRQIAKVGCQLMDFLVSIRDDEGNKALDEFLTDFGTCLNQVIAERAPLDAVFSPSRMMTTSSQFYFLFVGRLCRTNKGRAALDRNGILQSCLKLISITSHESYLKLVVSSLDYSQDGLTRIIFSKILNASPETSRLYATNMIRILVRLRLPDFHTWGMELLVTQVYDESRSVSLAALDILDEACDDRVNLEALIKLRPSLLHLGDRGQLLLVRFLSSPLGFTYLNNANYVNHEMEKWKKTYTLKYVKIVEDELNDALTRHQRGDDGNFQRRSSQRHVIRDLYIPPHLYGQLAQHQEGFDLLVDKEIIPPLVQSIKMHEMQTEEQILQLKASLWALGHVGSSTKGVLLLNDEQVIQDMVKLAEECPVFSIRGTCFNILGLMALTPTGADLLSQLGWESIRYHRREQWPILKDVDCHLDNNLLEMELEEDTIRSRESSSTSAEELDARSPSVLLPVNRLDAHARLQPSPSLDSDMLRFPTFPHSKTDFALDYHQRSVSEPQEPFNLVGSSNSIHSSPKLNAKLNVSTKGERNRSRSFNETISPFNGSNNNRTGEKLRSVSNIEIVNCDYKEERHDESSHTSRRSDSYTDSTSGIGSSDSSTGRLGVVTEHAQTLSPIASSTSINTAGSKVVHHSDGVRKLVNLRYTPIVPRRTNQGFLSHDQGTDAGFTYTMSRDVAGYAALRSMQRRRITSADADPWNIGRDRNWVKEAKARSLESGQDSVMYRLYTDFLHSTPNRLFVKKHSSSSSLLKLRENCENDVKYMGLCLPVDINMIFTVDDNEGLKSSGLFKIEEQSEKLNSANKYGLEYHSNDNCLKCVDFGGNDSSLKDVNDEQVLIRKEVLRLVISLSSSAAVKSSEQGLLSLKQKIPTAFRDLCLYSEILILMSRYKFRMTARRFLHELFLDVTFDQLHQEPARILNIETNED